MMSGLAAFGYMSQRAQIHYVSFWGFPLTAQRRLQGARRSRHVA
jgi:hypothetical protein